MKLKINAASLAVFLLACCRVSAQTTVDLMEGPVKVNPRFDLPAGTGPAQHGASSRGAAALTNKSLSFYTANYSGPGGVELPFNIVGSDPALGAHTTKIPTVIVPLVFHFSGTPSTTLDGSKVVAAIENSPIFQKASYTAGGVNLGFTQYGDALQRAEFWNLPGFSHDYHVLLNTPRVAPTVTVTVPARDGTAYALSSGGFLGVLDPSYFTQILNALVPGYSADEVPIFLTDNVYLGTAGLIQDCCILGFHSSEGPPAETARTWIYAAYAEPGTLGGFMDSVPLSHEVAEWLNDPFVGAFEFGFLNFVPPAVLPGQGGACIPNFETGDPLESGPYTFSKVTHGSTYHLQDEVVLPWYLHSTPSFSANGWYTFQNLSGGIKLVVNSPASVAGFYSDTATLLWAPVDKTVSADVTYVGRGCPAGSLGSGSPADPYLADPKGKIALIDRGACAVSLKVDEAARAGAVGVLIGLVAPGDARGFTLGGGSDFVPSLVITQATSNSIKGALKTSPVNATLSPKNAIPVGPSTFCGPG